jgi:predicted DNA-binding transcriptional regulator YafY
MAKIDSTKRYILIINKLRRQKRVTFQDIAGYLQRESELQGYNFCVSKRTFQRDVQDIGSIYGIYIKYDFSGKCWFIEDEFEPEINDRMFEAFNVYNALKMNEQLSQFMHPDNRQARGTEHIYGLLHATKNRLQVQLTYQKFYCETPSNRKLNPLALKEFLHRWYLLAQDTCDGKIKTYALDRIVELQILNFHFQNVTDFDINKVFEHCFGIILPNENEEPQTVVLSFTPFQGRYIKTLPLHASQKILLDNEQELRISLKIFLTHDFKMEILSFGENVKVIEPQFFAKEIKANLQAAAES